MKKIIAVCSIFAPMTCGAALHLPAGTASLRIQGQFGMGQNEIGVSACQSDAQKRPLRFGCQAAQPVPLNADIALAPGAYLIAYSNTWEFVTLTAGDRTEVQLKNIPVPSERQYDWLEVYLDLSKPAMQDTFLEMIYTNSENRQTYETQCLSYSYQPNGAAGTYVFTPSKDDKQACDAYASNDYHNLRDAVVSFYGSTWESWPIGGNCYDGMGNWCEQSEITVERVFLEPMAKGFISVLPGDYLMSYGDYSSRPVSAR